jgi:hypothetical protein
MTPPFTMENNDASRRQVEKTAEIDKGDAPYQIHMRMRSR